MEKKIQYSLGLMSMMLFIASIPIVSAKKDHQPAHQKKLENLNSPLYSGDSNVTVGQSFYIQCIARSPIEWYKDDKPIEMPLIRHSKNDYTYVQHDVKESDSNLMRSTLSVKHALLNHSGNYRCNVNPLNAHKLTVHSDKNVEIKSINDNDDDDEYEDEDDHNEIRESVKSTMMMYVTETSGLFSSNNNFNDESFEAETMKISDKIYEFDELIDATMMTTTESHAIKNHHKNHENYEIHSTHVALHDETTTLLAPTEIITYPPMHHQKGKLQAVYDKIKENGVESFTPYKLLNIGKPLVLSCNGSDLTKIKWKINTTAIGESTIHKGRYEVIGKEGKLVIHKATEDDAGDYYCTDDTGSEKFEVWANVVVKIPQNTYVVENEKLEIVCIVRGTHPEIKWEYSASEDGPREEINSTDAHRLLSDHPEMDGNHIEVRLTIDKVELSDRGYYYCIGWNEVMNKLNVAPAESDGIVRVKDKLAALWPFLGICAEVFVLCLIIFIYEKRRNKTDLDESDTDQSPDQKNDNMKDSDVRHRK